MLSSSFQRMNLKKRIESDKYGTLRVWKCRDGISKRELKVENRVFLLEQRFDYWNLKKRIERP